MSWTYTSPSRSETDRANASTSTEKGQSTILLRDSLVMIFNLMISKINES